MKRDKFTTLGILLLLSLSVVIINTEMSMKKVKSISSQANDAQESQYYVKLTAADEDYVNFSSMSGFTHGQSWTIIQRIKLPENPTTIGWSWFRGSAWRDKDGDMALGLDTREEHDYQIVYWIREDNSWNSLRMNRSQNGLTLQNDTWYNIATVFDRPTTTYELYIDGQLTDSLILPEMDDETNDNPLFFGGQYCEPGYDKGDLYSECDTALAHQAWFQRALTTQEIENYDGSVDNSDEDLFFATHITDDEITDASGNGRDGVNGNTPEYIVYTANAGYSLTFLLCSLGVTLTLIFVRRRQNLE